MGNGPGIVSLEGTDDLESLGKDANVAIVAGDEKVVGTGAYTAQIIALAVSAVLYFSYRCLTDIEGRGAIPLVR